MSESTNQKQPQEKAIKGGSRPQRTTSNPLQGSALFSSAPTSLPALPSLPQPSGTELRTPTSGASLLYNTPPPPEYILRQFEKRHDRQTIYIDARKAGALDALVQLVARKNKTDLVDEMVNDLLAKYAQVLEENEELVSILEERYRKKHNL